MASRRLSCVISLSVKFRSTKTYRRIQVGRTQVPVSSIKGKLGPPSNQTVVVTIFAGTHTILLNMIAIGTYPAQIRYFFLIH